MRKNDAELIQQVLHGSQDAFAALVKKYQKGVHALVWRKIGDFHVAQEITQDTFLKAYQKLKTLKNHSQFPGWLYVIASNLCNDCLRKKPLPEQSMEFTDPSEVAEVSYSRYIAEKQATDADETRREVVKKLLQKLPESERTVMTLHYLGEMTIKSISEFLGVSPNTVKSRLSRARNRLKKEEHMIRQNLASFQLPTQLTDNIMREVGRITPATPAGNKPMVPWALSAASAILIFLLMGVGTQYLVRFQKPYNLNATSESTVEIIEAAFILNSPAKPAVRNQTGNSIVPGQSRGTGQKPDDLLFAALPVDEEEVSTPEPQWVQTQGPEGGHVNTLFVTSNGEVYAGTGADIYRRGDDGSIWNLINSSEAFEGSWQMAEGNSTLYVVSETEVHTSVDRGETWNLLGARPEGHLIGIVITDEALYVGLVGGVFRSMDAGKSWTSLNAGLADRKIRAFAAVGNTLFVGTDSGLYRLDSDSWRQLPVRGETANIRALASSEHRLYVIVGKEGKNQVTSQLMSMLTTRKASLSLYRSTDLGDSWQAIGPDKILPVKTSGFTFGTSETKTEPTSSIKMIARQESLLILDSGRSYYSNDAGETWTALYSSHSDTDKPPVVVMLDEKTFYSGGPDGIQLTMDAGQTWEQFNTGLMNTSILNLAVAHDVLYANMGRGLLSSSDGGVSWIPVSGDPGNIISMIAFNDVLYTRGSKEMKPSLFRSSAENDSLTRISGMPDLGDTRFDSKQLDEDINLALLETLEGEDEINLEKGERLNPEQFDSDKFSEAYSKIMEKTMAKHLRLFLGSFAVSDGTYYMEANQSLFRWKPGTTEWYDTGLIDEGESAYAFSEFRDVLGIGFRMAVSGSTVYVGKRDGHLFQSFDEGETWNDVTADLPFSVGHFKAITFAGSTVYVATDQGVAYASDGQEWHPATDVKGTQIVVERLAADGTTVYGTTEKRVYRLKENAGTWKQVTPEVSRLITALTIHDNTLYIGTLGRGVLRFALDGASGGDK